MFSIPSFSSLRAAVYSLKLHQETKCFTDNSLPHHHLAFILTQRLICFTTPLNLHFQRFFKLQTRASVPPPHPPHPPTSLTQPPLLRRSVCIFSSVSRSASTQSWEQGSEEGARRKQNRRGGRLTHLIRSLLLGCRSGTEPPKHKMVGAMQLGVGSRTEAAAAAAERQQRQFGCVQISCRQTCDRWRRRRTAITKSRGEGERLTQRLSALTAG